LYVADVELLLGTPRAPPCRGVGGSWPRRHGADAFHTHRCSLVQQCPGLNVASVKLQGATALFPSERLDPLILCKLGFVFRRYEGSPSCCIDVHVDLIFSSCIAKLPMHRVQESQQFVMPLSLPSSASRQIFLILTAVELCVKAPYRAVCQATTRAQC